MASEVIEGGYDSHLFLSEIPPDVLKCLICHLVAKEPLQHEECGKLFCKSCIDEHKKRSKVCPNCRGENAQYFRDARSNREIQEYKIKCVNTQHGCDWTGELRAVEEHLTSCPYSMVTCTNKCLTSDGEEEEYKCLRKDLDQHLKECPKRKLKCPHCQEEGAYEERTTTHLETCPEIPSKCPNEDCDEELPAKRIKLHVSDVCPFTMKSCKYENIGCTAKLLRNDLETHQNDDRLHIRIAMETAAKKQEQLAAAQRKIRSLLKHMRSLQDSTVTRTYELTEFKKRKRNYECFNFPSFYTIPNGYHLGLQVYPNGTGDGEGTYMSAYIQIIEGDHDDHLKWPFVGTVTFELLNQLADKDHYVMRMDLDANDDANVYSARGYNNFIPHTKLYHRYLKKDTLYFRVSVKVSSHKPWLECTAAE